MLKPIKIIRCIAYRDTHLFIRKTIAVVTSEGAKRAAIRLLAPELPVIRTISKWTKLPREFLLVR